MPGCRCRNRTGGDAMKKGLSSEVTYDAAGNWMLIVRKERGKLTLEDIREAAME